MKTRDARTLRFDYASVPDDLNRLRRWMGTRFAPRPGKPGKVDKPPHRVRRGQPVVKAAKSEPENRATFEEACEAYERGDVDAIGLVLTADDPYFGLDEDDVLDHATGEVDATAHHIVHALGTYAEVSCSGTGLRAIGIGSKPEYAGCKSRALGFGVEVYDGTNRDGSEATSAAAFLVMTGNHLPGTPEGVEEGTPGLLLPHRQLPLRVRARATRERHHLQRRAPAPAPRKGPHRAPEAEADAHLRGAEAMQRTLAGMELVYRRKRHEQERRKAARPYTDEERVRLLVRQGMAERFARREVYGEPGLDEPPLEDAS